MLIVNELLDIAKSENLKLKTGEIILVCDFFKGCEWKRIFHSDRHFLGISFLNYIKSDDISVVPIEKTSYGQQKYKKTALLSKLIGQEEHNEIV